MLVKEGYNPVGAATNVPVEQMYPTVVSKPAFALDKRVGNTAEILDEFWQYREVLAEPRRGARLAEKVVIHTHPGVGFDIFIERGVGVYKIVDGEKVFLGRTDRGDKYQYIQRNYRKVKIHQLMLLMLCATAYEVYMTNRHLEINHLRIPERGVVSNEVDPFLLEVVTHDDNKKHKDFNRRWGIYTCPVPAMSVDDLDRVFTDMAKTHGVAVDEDWRKPVDFRKAPDLGLAIQQECWKNFRRCFPGVNILFN